MRIVVATHNAGKLQEFKRVLAQELPGVAVVGLHEIGHVDDPAETEFTFEGNALIKARAFATATGDAAIGDDSGLEVEVLNWMPGIRSARWAGPAKDDRENLELLLRQIDDVADPHRRARFVCAMALVLPTAGGGLEEHVVRGVMDGRLIREPRGENGFGYDPIFVPDGHEQTSGELEPAAKDAISHRGKALREMVGIMRRLHADGRL